LGTVADSLCSLKKLVFERQVFSLDQMREMLKANFDVFAEQRALLLKTAPKFGNDDDEADEIAARVVRDCAGAFDGYRTPQGGHYWALMAANVQNISAGLEVGATPDGRLAGTPVSDASSPHFGRDTNGPTAAMKSVAKLPYRLCRGGNVVNMKLSPDCLRGHNGLRNLAALIRTCFSLGGTQLQFNTTGRQTLLDAMEHPENHGNLVVRVSGFSARFVHLDRAVQEDILARSEHVIG